MSTRTVPRGARRSTLTCLKLVDELGANVTGLIPCRRRF